MKLRLRNLILLALTLSACTTGPTRRTYNDGVEQPTPAPAKPHPLVKDDPIKKAQTFYSNGDYASAEANLDSVPESTLSPQRRTEYWNLKGLIELANKNPAAAELSFQSAITVNPNPKFSGYYQYNLASAMTDEKKVDEATHVLDMIDPTHMDPTDQHKIDLLKQKLSRMVGVPTVPGSGVAGGSDVAAVQSPTPEPTPAKVVYNGPVNKNRIGLLLPLSGKYESFGKKVQRAIELAFENENLTKKNDIELIAEDSGDTQGTQQAALKKLVEEHQVIAVIGPLLSKGIEALNTADDFYATAMLSIAQAQAQGNHSPYIFSCSISNEDQAAKMVGYATSVRGFKRFAIMAPSNKAGEEMAYAFWDQVNSHGGEVTGFELYEPSLVDYREPVDKILGLFYKETRGDEARKLANQRKALGITKKTMKTIQYFELSPVIDFDAVFIADEAKAVGQIMPTFAYRNAKNLPYLGVSSWNSPQLITRGADQAEGAAFPVAFNTLNPSEEAKHFYDLYTKTYSSVPGELDAIAFDAASTILEVLKDHPSTREEFNDKLATASKIAGATGVLNMKDHRCERNLAIYTVKNGQFESVNATKENPKDE